MTEQPLQQQLNIARGVLSQMAATSKEAAAQIDAGTYSVDDRIKAMHQLFDLSVQGWVALVQAVVSGPALGVKWNARPEPCDPILVPANPTYPRKLEVAVSFAQIGAPSVVIPDHQISFIPQVLKVGATEFQIGVKDPSLSGRCYTGTVRVTTITPAGVPSEEETLPILDVEL